MTYKVYRLHLSKIVDIKFDSSAEETFFFMFSFATSNPPTMLSSNMNGEGQFDKKLDDTDTMDSSIFSTFFRVDECFGSQHQPF